MKKLLRKSTITWILLMTLIFSTSLTLVWFFSALPLSFLHLELGKIFAAPFKLYLIIALWLISGIAFSILIISMRTRGILDDLRVLFKSKRRLKLFLLSLTLSLLLLLSFSTMLILGITEKHQKIDAFVFDNMNLSLHDYINEAEIFLNDNVNNSWDKPEDEFKIDNMLYASLLDSTILNSLGLTRADVILYQGWGACGQEAFVIEELLCRAGYTTRRAHFIGEGADHGWAEVYWNGSWFMVNPWWLGKWVEISNLRWMRPQFENYTTPEVMYRNGTHLDLGEDYGY